MIQLDFPPRTRRGARHQPSDVGYSQHNGAERAAWAIPSREGRRHHPVVYPAEARSQLPARPLPWQRALLGRM
jgi:hypothetical protein